MYTDRIENTLSLTIKGKSYTVPGANIKECNLNLETSGFSGEMTFWLSSEQSEDKLLDAFTGVELISFELSVQNYTFSDKEKSEKITLKGLIGKRSVLEAQFVDVKDSKVLFHKYKCVFTDPAQFLWKQHYPTELYVDQTMKDVINAQVVDPISIKLTWDKLSDKKPMICLGMGAYKLSFYQFLLDYINENCVYFIYDYSKNAYEILDKKAYADTENRFLPHQLSNVHVHFPETDFQSVNILNGNTDQAKITEVAKNKVVQNIKNDFVIVTPFSKDVEAEKTLEKTRNTQVLPTLDFQFTSYPMKAVFPGSSICLDHDLWNKSSLFFKKKYRTVSSQIYFSATENHVENDLNLSHTNYTFSVQLKCEEKENVSFNKRINQLKPFYVEGLLLSDTGEDSDKTYQYKKNDDTKQNEYRIKIPLWDKEIKLVFKPDFINPHFYFPLYKNTRVRLEMHLFYARIDRVLDWGKSVFLEQDTQGNHLLFGKNNTDETSLKHVYEDNKPVFSILRTKEKDTELFRMEEGVMIFETKENE